MESRGRLLPPVTVIMARLNDPYVKISVIKGVDDDLGHKFSVIMVVYDDP